MKFRKIYTFCAKKNTIFYVKIENNITFTLSDFIKIIGITVSTTQYRRLSLSKYLAIMVLKSDNFGEDSRCFLLSQLHASLTSSRLLRFNCYVLTINTFMPC